MSINADESFDKLRMMRKCKCNNCTAFIPDSKANILTIFPHRKYVALNYLLFAVYLILLCWLMTRVPFVKRSGISGKIIILLFLLKIAAGIAIGWLSLHVYGTGNDYWDMNTEGWKEYQLLVNDPGEYFRNIFTSGYPEGYSGFFSSVDSFWNDLKGNIIIKLVSVFNIFSRGDYYINSLFFNFLVFFGHVALYRLFIKIYPGRTTLVIIGCFLLPSLIYFSSGIHKDGIVFLMLSVLIYCIYQSLQQNRINKKYLLLIIVSLIFLLLIRHFIFIALVPALMAWIISVKFKQAPVKVFAIVYVVAGLLLFNINSLISQVKPLEIITRKQYDYMHLPKSETEINLTTLNPNFKSFASNTPQALNHILFRPYLWELPVKSLLPLNIELLLYQLLFLAFLFFRRRETILTNTPFIWFAIVFTLSIFLLTGYIVPNLGSIVRYRSLYLPLIITPLLCSIDWDKLRNVIKIKK
jgi:hypothetical protein